MKKAIALLSILLAGAVALSAQNRIAKGTVGCVLADPTTADGLEARASDLAARAATTCPAPPPTPPPSGGQWTVIQHGYYSNFGAASGPGGTNCGAPLAGALTCGVFLPQPVTPGNILVYLPLFYNGGPMSLVSVNGEGLTTCNQCAITEWWDAIQIGVGYTLAAKGGETTLTGNFNAKSTGWVGLGVIEAHWSGSGGVTFGAGSFSLGPCGTSCNGVPLPSICSGSNALVVQVDFPFNTNPNSISAPFQFTQGSWGISTSGQASTPTWFEPASDPKTSNDAVCFIGS